MNLKNLVEKNKKTSILKLVIVSIIVLLIIVGVIIAISIKTNNSSIDEKNDLSENYKYEITYRPLSAIESSEKYEFYIDLKNKEITKIETDYWISKKVGESKDFKKIDDETNNKLIKKIRKIEKNDINKNNKEMCSYKHEKYKKININENEKIDNDLLEILLEDI